MSELAPHVKAEIDGLDDQTVEALTERAKSLGLTGYSEFTKDELVKALAAELRKNPPPEPRIG